MSGKIGVLFVCMGNICRSPTGEGVFRALAEKRGLLDKLEIDSAGTIGYHAGNPADSRMQAAANKRGYRLDSRARRVKSADLDKFDYVLAADKDNLFDLHSLDADGSHGDRIKLLTEYHPDKTVDHVPDPYYGGPQGFELVLDLVEICCEHLLNEIEERLKAGA
ncbi:MAG: low molecular weight phosphotyrosine protein phosphatase [Candidatus Sumerlaeia bacterium]|nr:low molecular weight phosphotyrosine protein phosphatase [Candidatus Sumerlaeia bacterium]